MTNTLLFWFKWGAIALIVYTLFTLVRPMVRRKYIVPKQKKEWGSLISDLFSLAAGIFLIFILQKNYSAPIETVLQYQGKEFPSVQFLNTSTNSTEQVSDYRNKIVILNIWATWCGPCRKEMPELQKLQQEFPNELAVVALSDESADKIRSFQLEKSLNLIMGSISSPNSIISQINTRPVSVLLIDGKVKDIVVGSRGYSFFKDWVLPYR